MRIEEGRFYKTRDGRKVGPARRDGGLWELGGDHFGLHNDNGTYCPSNETGMDLIAEWSDGPVRTETVTRKVIVPGRYGRVTVGLFGHDGSSESHRQWVNLDFDISFDWNAAELRVAAATFIELADALEQQP